MSSTAEIHSSITPLTTSVRITIPTSNPAQLDPSIVTPASDPDLYDYAIEEDESPGEEETNEDFDSNICGDKEKVGRWSDQEHQVFLDGLNHYGKQWKTIASMIGTRTVVQVRTHAQKYFQKMDRSSGSSDESVTRSPKKVGQRSTHPKRKSLPSVMPSRKKQRKPRQLSMAGTTRDVSAVQVETAAKIAETVDPPPFPSFIFKSTSSTSSENWSTISPNAVVNTEDLQQYHTETTDGAVEAGTGSADFDLLEEDPLEWLIETDCSQQYLPESSLPLFPFLQDDNLITEPEDESEQESAPSKEPQADIVQDAIIQNMVDPNVTMQSLFLTEDASGDGEQS